MMPAHQASLETARHLPDGASVHEQQVQHAHKKGAEPAELPRPGFQAEGCADCAHAAAMPEASKHRRGGSRAGRLAATVALALGESRIGPLARVRDARDVRGRGGAGAVAAQ